MIFSEGEEEQIIRAAVLWHKNGLGESIIVGREDKIRQKAAEIALDGELASLKIINSAISDRVDHYIEYLYGKLQRKGYLHRDCVRMVKNDRNIFASCMLACGDGDAMVTGLTRGYAVSLDNVCKVIDTSKDSIVFGMTLMIAGGKTFFISDTTVNELPTAKELANIAVQTAEKAKNMGHEPRVAMLSFSNFGNPRREKSERVRQAVEELEKMDVDFEFDGEISAGVALNAELLKLYPFSRLTKPANVLIMPALHSANISSKLLQEIGGGVVIGPILTGLEKSVQVMQMGATASEILNMCAIAASDKVCENS